MQTLPFELYETNHGIDGFDAKTKLVARFSSIEKAEQYLANRQYTYKQYGSYYHQDPVKRHNMGILSYEIRPSLLVPENPS